MITVTPNLVPPTYVGNGNVEKVSQEIQARIDVMPPSEAGFFLALLYMPDLSPPSNLSPEELSTSLDRLAGAAHLLEMVAHLADAGDMIGRLLIEQASQQRHNALNDRLNAREIAKANLYGQADDM